MPEHAGPSSVERWESSTARRTLPQKLGLTLSAHEDGPTWLGRLLGCVGLRAISQRFGLGVHSDYRLLGWAQQREINYRDAYDRAMTAAVTYGGHKSSCPRSVSAVRANGLLSCTCGWMPTLAALVLVPEGSDPHAWTTAIERARSRS